MRFWKFIKDELEENQQSSQNNAISEEQKQDNESQQGTGKEQQSQPQQETSQEKNSQSSSSEQNQEPSKQSSDAQQNEEQKMSDSQSQQGDSQEKNSQNSRSEQSQEPSQQSSDAQQNEEQEMSDGQPQQETSQGKNSQSSNSEQNQESPEQSIDPKQTDEQKLSNESRQGASEDQQNQSQQGDSQEKNSQNSSSEQNQEPSEQSSDSQQTDEQKLSNESQQGASEDQQSQSQQGDSQERNSQSSSSEQNQESSQQSEKQEITDNQSQQREMDTKDFPSNEIEDSKEKIEQISEEIINNNEFTTEQKRDLLEGLKKSIEETGKRKAEQLHRERINPEKQELLEESKEEKYELSEQTNEFLNQLGELPSFENRDRGPGYSIDTESFTEIPESVIRTLITKFLNQRFCKCNTDLNVRSNSSEKANGFYRWEVKDVIVHLQTHQITKVLTDKYGYDYEQGKGDNIPLSFYFDMSYSMSKYTNMLAVISIELLKKGVKVLIGYNERVNVQIESIEKNITISELAQILKSAGYWSYWGISDRNKFKKDHRVKFKYVEKNIDNYLIEKKAEKCVVFADFDPKNEIINLSQVVDVYWFCFERSFSPYSVDNFNGFIYSVQNIKDLEKGLLKINEKRFETLCYTDNPKSLQKKVR